MTKKCIYCNRELSDNNIVDFCDSCGVKVWGEKMFNAIKENMEDARKNGDLFSVNYSDDKINKIS